MLPCTGIRLAGSRHRSRRCTGSRGRCSGTSSPGRGSWGHLLGMLVAWAAIEAFRSSAAALDPGRIPAIAGAVARSASSWSRRDALGARRDARSRGIGPGALDRPPGDRRGGLPAGAGPVFIEGEALDGFLWEVELQLLRKGYTVKTSYQVPSTWEVAAREAPREVHRHRWSAPGPPRSPRSPSRRRTPGHRVVDASRRPRGRRSSRRRWPRCGTSDGGRRRSNRRFAYRRHHGGTSGRRPRAQAVRLRQRPPRSAGACGGLPPCGPRRSPTCCRGRRGTPRPGGLRPRRGSRPPTPGWTARPTVSPRLSSTGAWNRATSSPSCSPRRSSSRLLPRHAARQRGHLGVDPPPRRCGADEHLRPHAAGG